MKFGKSLTRVIEISDPEWGQYWINYKFLKRKINDMVEARGGGVTAKRRSNSEPTTDHHHSLLYTTNQSYSHHTGAVVHAIVLDNAVSESAANTSTSIIAPVISSHPLEIAKSKAEVEFFMLLRRELKKTSDFFTKAEQEYKIRWERIWESYLRLQESSNIYFFDKNTWTRLLSACVKLYKDVLMLENFAIMNYCGFSKILKKHDKKTGFITREAFMRNVMNHQNFTHYPYVLELIRRSEQLFRDIQGMESVMPLQDEERLFIDAIRDLNNQASRIQQVDRHSSSDSSEQSGDSNKKELHHNNNHSHHNNTEELSHTSSSYGSSSSNPQIDDSNSSSHIASSSSNNISLIEPSSSSSAKSLEAATTHAMEASMRLNQDQQSHLNLVLSWIQRQQQQQQSQSSQQHSPTASFAYRTAIAGSSSVSSSPRAAAATTTSSTTQQLSSAIVPPFPVVESEGSIIAPSTTTSSLAKRKFEDDQQK